VRHEQTLGMALQPGSIEVGSRRSEMSRKPYNAGEIFLYYRHVERWIRSDDLHYLSIVISDAALTSACDGIRRLRRFTELMQAKIEEELTLQEMAECAGNLWKPNEVRSPLLLSIKIN